jgi:hypothetical protein
MRSKLIRRCIAVAIIACALFVRSTYIKSAESNSAIAREACSLQFRYLKQTLHAMDLTGPPVVTDGYTTNIAEAEWPFMAVAYYGYACANIAQCDEAKRPEAIAEMRWALGALQTPRLSGFMKPHFGPPFGDGPLTPAVFVHGHFLSLAVRYREVTGDTQYDALMERIATALDKAYAEDELGVLLSYKHPPMWWLTDNFPALSALARYDRIFHTHYGAGKDKFLATLKDRYLDSKTGMFCTYADSESRKAGQGPRGISMMYGLHFLRDFAPEFAKEQYALAKKDLFGSVLGCSAVREFPVGQESTEDIDSGPLVMGFGPSASGFAIAATATMDDAEAGGQLLRSLFLLGLEVREGDKLYYREMPEVGQAVILFGRTELLKRVAHRP